MCPELGSGQRTVTKEQIIQVDAWASTGWTLARKIFNELQRLVVCMCFASRLQIDG